MWRPALRIFIQLALSAPVLVLSPFALALSVASLLSAATLEPGQTCTALTFILSGLGLPFLLLSIVMTTRALRRSPWRLIISTGLIAGVVGAVLWVVGTGGVTQPERIPYDVWTMYLFGGPIIVAAWNLWRAWRNEVPADAASTQVTSHP